MHEKREREYGNQSEQEKDHIESAVKVNRRGRGIKEEFKKRGTMLYCKELLIDHWHRHTYSHHFPSTPRLYSTNTVFMMYRQSVSPVITLEADDESSSAPESAPGCDDMEIPSARSSKGISRS